MPDTHGVEGRQGGQKIGLQLRQRPAWGCRDSPFKGTSHARSDVVCDATTFVGLRL